MKLFRYISIIVFAAATAANAYADKTNFRWVKDIDYAKVRHFSQGHSAFQENGKWGFINTAGEVVVEPQYDECHDYQNNFAAVKVNGKWGFIDRNHNLVIAPEFEDVQDFKNGLAIVLRDGKWGVINTTGKSPAGIIFDEVHEYRDGFALAYADSVQYFLDDEGEIRRLHKGYEFTGFSNGMAPVKNKKKNKWGFIDKRGRLVIETRYDTVYSFSNDIALVKHRGTYKYIRKSGAEQYIEGISGQPLEFVNGFAKIQSYNGYSFISSDFKRLPYTYKEVSDFKRGNMAAVRLGDNTLCYINASGKEKFKSDYDMIGDFSENGLALVKKNGKFGYINTDGKLVIDTLFTDATDFQFNHAYVATADRFGFIRYEQGYKTPSILVPDFRIEDNNGDGVVETNEEFTITMTVRNPSNEEMKDVLVTIENQVAHEEWFDIPTKSVFIPSLASRKDSVVVFHGTSNLSLESGDISMRLAARPGNMLCHDIEELTFKSRGIAASKPALSQYWVHTEDHRPLYEGSMLNLSLTVKNEGKDPAKDIRIRFHWPDGVEGEQEELTIAELNAGESTEVITRFATAFNMPEETIVVELSDATGKNDTFRYITYYQGRMNTPRGFEGESAAYNPYMNMNMAAMYGGGYYSMNGTANMGSRMEGSNQSGLGQKKEVPELLKDIATTAEANENKYALIIGNEDYNKYSDGTVESPNVEFAKADAEAFKQYAINYMGVPKEHCIGYNDATLAVMKRGINQLTDLCKTKNGNAEIYVFYAGHGQPDEDSKKTYLIPCDCNLKEPTSGYKLDDFYNAISEMQAKKKMVFLDACYSGQGRAGWIELVYDEPSLRGDIVVMTATSGEEKSMPYKEKKQGTFTYHLLNTIKGAKGEITVKNLFDIVASKVGETSILVNGSKQTPQIITGEGIQEGWEEWKIY